MGPPGVGKGTQAEIIKDYYNIPHLSTGQILRNEIADHTDIGEKAKKYIDDGEFVPDDILSGIIKKNIVSERCPNGYILDGYPRNIPQAKSLEKLTKELNQNIDLVINLIADENELIKRLIKRSQKSSRTDDTKEIILKRQEIYWEQTAPIIEYYKKLDLLKEINGIGKVLEISERIKKII